MSTAQKEDGLIHEEAAPKDHSMQFLLREYQTLWEWRRKLLELQESRVTVFMTTIGATFLALGFVALNVSPYFSEYPYVIVGFCLLFAVSYWRMGWITFVRAVERGVEAVFATRAMNAIRGYFVQYDPTLAAILLYPLTNDVPHFASFGFLEPKKAMKMGLPQVVAIVNNLIATTAVALAVRIGGEPILINQFHIANDQAKSLLGTAALCIGGAIFLFVGNKHSRYYKNRVQTLQAMTTPEIAARIANKTQ